MHSRQRRMMSSKTIALLLATLYTVTGHWGRRYGGYQTFRNSGGFQGFSLKSYYDDVWTSTGTVPEKLSEVPLEPLAMRVAGQGGCWKNANVFQGRYQLTRSESHISFCRFFHLTFFVGELCLHFHLFYPFHIL